MRRNHMRLYETHCELNDHRRMVSSMIAEGNFTHLTRRHLQRSRPCGEKLFYASVDIRSNEDHVRTINYIFENSFLDDSTSEERHIYYRRIEQHRAGEDIDVEEFADESD